MKTEKASMELTTRRATPSPATASAQGSELSKVRGRLELWQLTRACDTVCVTDGNSAIEDALLLVTVTGNSATEDELLLVTVTRNSATEDGPLLVTVTGNSATEDGLLLVTVTGNSATEDGFLLVTVTGNSAIEDGLTVVSRCRTMVDSTGKV